MKALNRGGKNMDNTTYYEICQQSTSLCRIGAGFCGTVWADPEVGVMAIKREDGGQGRSLKNDSDIHQRLLAAQKDHHNQLRFEIPLWHDYIQADDAADIITRFPSGYSPSNILLTERIPPMPAVVRRLLIDEYCPPAAAPSIAVDPKNHDCLIRPYLGRRRRGFSKSAFRIFSLRNYPLHLDQIEYFSLDPYTYAQRMAEALAFMHWCAQIDANDVEFVLAPPSPRAQTQTTLFSAVLGKHNLWILDFDCCRPMTMDKSGMEQAARAFWKNDPFYPRPGKEQESDVNLWEHFKRAFLAASTEFIQLDDQKHLPGLLIQLIEAKSP
ncbi:zinc finger protein-domain-containing protein [Xylariaceae sp. FL0255]|nr:zinc finger protein-domain-containing protein [Xylariaceae sp. FL0255]